MSFLHCREMYDVCCDNNKYTFPLRCQDQVEDLKLVTGQQQLVISRLRAEAEHRADKIAALVGAGPGTRHATLTAAGRLRNIGSSNLPTRPLPNTTLGANIGYYGNKIR